MKIAFILDNSNIVDKEIQNIENGNPGMGATEYLFFSLCFNLTKKNFDSYMYLYKNQEIGNNIKKRIVDDSLAAIDLAIDEEIDIIVARNYQSQSFYNKLSTTKLKCIIWAHNYNYEEQTYVSDTPNVKAYVCVSKAQLEEICCFDGYQKMTYIYNYIPKNMILSKPKRSEKKSLVCQGALTETKGFHLLAEIWPTLSEKIPDLELHVVGSGNLYNNKTKLGKYGLAEEKYEKKFIKYFLDEEKKVDPRIHFHGTISNIELKNDIIQNSTIGILNLSGKSECCPMSGVEMQALGVPLITTNKCGCRDVLINNKTGFTVCSTQEAVDKIICLIENDDLRYDFQNNAIEFVKKRFSIDSILSEWCDLFTEIYIGNNIALKHDIGLKYKIYRFLKRNIIFKLYKKTKKLL